MFDIFSNPLFLLGYLKLGMVAIAKLPRKMSRNQSFNPVKKSASLSSSQKSRPSISKLPIRKIVIRLELYRNRQENLQVLGTIRNICLSPFVT